MPRRSLGAQRGDGGAAVLTESVVFERFHNWALFTGGLLLGWELRTIRRDLTAER